MGSIEQLFLSVVVATTHPWPAVRECLEILLPQCRASGAEIILGDATGRGLPTPLPDALRHVRHLIRPAASVFALRAAATAAATGTIVAWTEDHCLPASDWCRCILQSHTLRPDAAAIGGALTNGSTSTTMDWANFLCTSGPFLPPLPARLPRVPTAANISFKRHAIPSGPLAPGFVELILEERLWNAGLIAFDDAILVRHIQSRGWFSTAAAHFHNGRSCTGLARKHQTSRQRWKRLALCATVPYQILRSAAGSRRKPGIPLLRCLPLMALLALAHTSGEVFGLLRGAGNSPTRLE